MTDKTKPSWRFWNAPLTITLVGFFLTGLVGTGLTQYWDCVEKNREQKSAEVQKQDEELRNARSVEVQRQEEEVRSIRDVVNRAILEREIASDRLVNALQHKDSTDEVKLLWLRYENAVLDEANAYVRNHLNIEGVSEQGEAKEIPVTTVFWHYLDLVIQPRFADLDNCIDNLRKAYLIPASTSEALISRFQDCDDQQWVPKMPDKPHQYYWDQFVAPTEKGQPLKGVRKRDNFNECLENFSYHLDWYVRLESWRWQGMRNEKSGGMLGSGSRQPICWEEHFLRTLHDELAVSCGEYTPGGQPDSPVTLVCPEH